MSLRNILNTLNGKPYWRYKSLQGKKFRIKDFEVIFDHVQADPFASPSRLRIRIPTSATGFPRHYFNSTVRKLAFEDFLLRKLCENSKKVSKRRGNGKSGLILFYTPSQQVLKRTAVGINENFVETRFLLGLPARGRTILGKQAYKMFFHDLPEIVNSSLKIDNLNIKELENHINTVEDAEYLRKQLIEKNMVAFIADGSILPRKSGIDDRPMNPSDAIPFRSPPSLRVTFELPHRGKISGMGIPSGITLIVGGGFHGKTTLLQAIQKGVYNHIPGDGREFVITVKDAVKVKAEEGRSIKGVDISSFLKKLPDGSDTHSFYTENASGSTSQAASIIEAIEAKTSLLLIDEDTSATNFMIRDEKIQALIPSEAEPIIPFIERVRELYERFGISTILVTGGTGEYLEKADLVIGMINYVPQDLTPKAKEVVKNFKVKRKEKLTSKLSISSKRKVWFESLTTLLLAGKFKIKTENTNYLMLGKEVVDVSSAEQIVEEGQLKSIGGLIMYFAREKKIVNVVNLVEQIQEKIKEGLDSFSPYPYPPDLTEFRPQDFLFVLNRIRSLRIK